jgi:peptide/nickel transport system ATP-binding protein
LAAAGVGVTGPAGVIVRPTDLTVGPGEVLGIVGESGSGKTLLVKALLGLLPEGLAAAGAVWVDGRWTDLGQGRAPVRGKAVLVPQDPFTSLDPTRRVGDQVADSAPAGRRPKGRRARRAFAAERLAEVHLGADSARRYPHQLSGGMRQRAAIAAALAVDPPVLVADEPTTALDVTTQRDILDLLDELRRSRGMAVVLISHDLALVRQRAGSVLVMRAGEVVERGEAAAVFAAPAHPHTAALRAATPTLDQLVPAGSDLVSPATSTGPNLAVPTVPAGTAHLVHSPALPNPDSAAGRFALRAIDLRHRFAGAAGEALAGVSFEVRQGESVGLVGESGSGKTTLARCLVGLQRPGGGTVEYWDGARRRPAGPTDVQMVFQDPYSTLNPALTLGATLREAVGAAGGAHQDRLTPEELMDLVGLPRGYLRRRPANLSGGERQRVAIARALAPRPRILVCDEATSALDVTVQARILDLLGRLRQDLGLSLLFISHNLAVTAQITDRLGVMREGRLVEEGSTAEVLAAPAHPYTQALRAAVPAPLEAAAAVGAGRTASGAGKLTGLTASDTGKPTGRSVR